MRVPLSWLKEFTPLAVSPDDEVAVAELRAVLDGLGLVVESVEHAGGSLPGVVLARVLEINAIEGADRVRQVYVDQGDGERLEIVCGATNFALGDVVPLARIGTELPGGMVIAERKMRGATSMGMLCSGRELGIGDDAAGLMIVASPGAAPAPLPDEIVLGRRLDEHLGAETDVVFELDVQPNRPDGLSIVGVARDVAAKLGLPFTIPTPVVVESDPEAGDLASVAIRTFQGCAAILGRVLTNVQQFSSPDVVRRRLELCGMRSINAVVDASNYVMLELGQPTHPYDLDRLGANAAGRRGIVVRLAEPGETLFTLDGTERTLGVERLADGDVRNVEDLVIADTSGAAVGLAGVMGGASSEIGEDTTRILLEVASFDPLLVGRAAARQGLRSEASARFWRGTDPAGLKRAADRFCELVQSAARAAGATVPTVARGVLGDGELDPEPRTVSVRPGRVNALLATDLDEATIVSILAPLGFEAVSRDGALAVTIPSWRPDASREVDVIEEVARHYGYEKIGSTERRSPRVGSLTMPQASRRRLRAALVGAGVTEAWTSSIVDPEGERSTGAEGPFIEVTHPIVHGETVLRTGLLAGLLRALAHNESHRNGDVRLFEIGTVFGALAIGPDERPVEREQLAVLLANDDDARSATALFSVLADALRLDPEGYLLEQGELRPVESAELATGMHPARRATVVARRADPRTRPVVAVVGEVDPDVLTSFGIGRSRVGWLVANLEGLFSLPRRPALAKPVSRYPSSDLDLAFVLDEEVPAARLTEQLVRGAGELLAWCRLLDVYRGPGVPEGTRSLTYRLRLGALDHTLSERELADARNGVITLVESRLPARLRA